MSPRLGHNPLRPISGRQRLLCCPIQRLSVSTGYPWDHLPHMAVSNRLDVRACARSCGLYSPSNDAQQYLRAKPLLDVMVPYLFDVFDKAFWPFTDCAVRYLICLTIAPAFLSGGIYLCLSRIIVVYGEHLARFKPRTYTVIFVCSDIFALVLQALGGAIADTTTSGSRSQRTGVNIMIAGLAFQVISLTIFIILCLDFAWRIRTRGVSSRPTIRLFGCGPARFHIFMLGK